MGSADLPEWKQLLAAERHLQALQPRFDEVLSTLEGAAG
jgi:hypothetical protein